MHRARKIVITGFIFFNFLIMIRVHLSLESKFFKTIYKPIDSYLSFLSLFQTWTMYAPNPSRTNAYLSAEIEFKDGSREKYIFPRPTEMSLKEKYINGERFRVLIESIRLDKNQFLWADTAKYALRKIAKYNSKKPLKVHLFRHWNITPEMEKEFRPHLSKDHSYQNYKFFTYEVL